MLEYEKTDLFTLIHCHGYIRITIFLAVKIKHSGLVLQTSPLVATPGSQLSNV